MWSTFETRVPGKWVLAGEHTVLRGGSAVALPHPDFSLKLSFTPGTSSGLTVFPDSATAVIRDLLRAVEDRWQNEDRSFPKPQGELKLESTIPIGSGLGSSAALCVAMTRWLAGPLGIPAAEIQEFATQLEHRFHGRSSGMDIAVTSAGQPVAFSMERGAKALGVRSLPKFTFHDTGLRARTSDCVVKVEAFREENPILAMKTDELMGLATRNSTEGLIRFSAGDPEGLRLLAQGMKQAQEAFYTWKLVPDEGRRLEADLFDQGALAVKLTGAGGGGFLVALWPSEPL